MTALDPLHPLFSILSIDQAEDIAAWPARDAPASGQPYNPEDRLRDDDVAELLRARALRLLRGAEPREHRRARRSRTARRRVLTLSLVSLLAMGVSAAVMFDNIADTPRPPLLILFWAGWAVAAPAAGASALIIATNWSLLPRQTAALGLVPWAIISALAIPLAQFALS